MENLIFKTEKEQFDNYEHKDLVIKLSSELKGKSPDETMKILLLIKYYINSTFKLT